MAHKPRFKLTQRNRSLSVVLLPFLCMLLSSAVFSAKRVDRSRDRSRIGTKPVIQLYEPTDKEYYLTAEQIAFIRPGLVLELSELTIPADLHPVVEFSIQDPAGLPLDIEGIYTPGPVSVTFLISRIPEGETQHVNYNTRTATNPDTGESTEQADRDRGGTFTEIGDGVYIYRYNSALAADFDRTAPHTVGVYARRDLREFDLDRYVENKFIHFLPTEGEVTLLDTPARDVVRTEACNQCHNPLALHGGARLEVELCIQCHTPQTLDPDSENTVDFKVMIHKIHRGASLPSVQAGIPYQIIGFGGSVHDYSDVHFPQDIRNCETCHTAEATQQAAYVLRPTRDACGSCHDDVNFMSGEGHAGGPVISDNFCSSCHFPIGELEFDASIIGGHTIPAKSAQLDGINIEILDVVDTAPGDNPTVLFELTNNMDEEIAPSSLPFFNLVLAGPTTDYAMRVSEAAGGAVPVGGISAAGVGAYSYTFEAAIPADAKGSFAMGAEAFRMVLLNPDTTKEFSHRETAENPVFYFPVTDAEAIPRRTSVTDEKCETCHENLSLHGTIRHDPEYCNTCHNPNADDSPFRAAEDMPARTIHFKMMIHRIHRGHELTRDYTLIGFGGGSHNYNEVRYPGDLRDCTSCHVGDSYEVPSPGVLPTITSAPEREFFSPIAPDSAACLGCHDSLDAAAHAFLNIAPFGEACGACHGSGAAFDVARVHAR